MFVLADSSISCSLATSAACHLVGIRLQLGVRVTVPFGSTDTNLYYDLTAS